VSERVFLHVGCPKTGTTFLQQVLWSQRDVAADQGLLLPLGSFYDHFLATLDVRDLADNERHPPRAVGIWQRVVAETEEWRGNVLVSHELFAAATAEQAQRAIAAFDDTEVHVVVTARDLVRQIPAEWQEHVKHRSLKGFSAFVEEVLDDREGRSWFWRVQDVAKVVSRWGRWLPRERVHVVVVPPAGTDPTQLWRRFAGVIGVDHRVFALDRGRANTSLGAEQAELLRQVNAELGDRLPMPGPYPGVAKDLFAHQILATRTGTPYALTGSARDAAIQRSEEMAKELEELGVDVVGDVSELVPGPVEPAGPGTDVLAGGPDAVSDQALLREAVAGLAALLHSVHQRDQDAARELAAARAESQRLVDEMEQQPYRHLVRVLSRRWGWLMRARVVVYNTRKALGRVRRALGLSGRADG
jgi:hypothetical protein